MGWFKHKVKIDTRDSLSATDIEDIHETEVNGGS